VNPSVEFEGNADPSGVAKLYKPGTHVCLIYDGEAERREVVAQFIEEGLTGGERVAYFTDVEPDGVCEWLSEHGVCLPESDQFSTHRARDVYCPDGHFHPERMYGYWHEFYDDARSKGFAAARATGETSWSREVEGGERIVEYEARLNDVLASMPVTALCQYDVRRFDGATILDVLRIHPVMLVGGQLVQNPYYQTPEQFFASKTPASA
jgi:hypothetical protein